MLADQKIIHFDVGKIASRREVHAREKRDKAREKRCSITLVEPAIVGRFVDYVID